MKADSVRILVQQLQRHGKRKERMHPSNWWPTILVWWKKSVSFDWWRFSGWGGFLRKGPQILCILFLDRIEKNLLALEFE